MMNGITNYILLITLLIYGSRAPAQNVKQENDSVKMNKPFNMVYEFGHGRVREHLCGIYEFLESKKMESLQELEKK